MKSTSKMLAALAVALLSLAIAAPVRAEEGETLTEDMHVKVFWDAAFKDRSTAGENTAENIGSPLPEVVDYMGVKAIGHVQILGVETQQLRISGDAGFQLPESETGGILHITFAPSLAEKPPVKATLRQFPIIMDPAETELDGRPIIMEIAAGQKYIHMTLDSEKQTVLSSVTFEPGKTLQDGAEERNDAIIIKINKKNTLGSQDIETLKNATSTLLKSVDSTKKLLFESK